MAEVIEGNIAKEFKIGNTKVKIATDFCQGKTPEQVEEILERIAIAAKQSYMAMEYAKNQEKRHSL